MKIGKLCKSVVSDQFETSGSVEPRPFSDCDADCPSLRRLYFYGFHLLVQLTQIWTKQQSQYIIIWLISSRYELVARSSALVGTVSVKARGSVKMGLRRTMFFCFLCSLMLALDASRRRHARCPASCTCSKDNALCANTGSIPRSFPPDVISL